MENSVVIIVNPLKCALMWKFVLFLSFKLKTAYSSHYANDISC